MRRLMTYDSPLGTLYLTAERENLVGLRMAGQRGCGPVSDAVRVSPTGVLAEAARWLDAYFAGRRPVPCSLPLAPEGSPFRRRVWQELCRIPYGERISYGGLAARVDSSPRAVGGAVGHNPIAIIIPCHRVVAAGGLLGGYAGGEERKRFLLAHEAATSVLLACERALR